MVTQFGHVLLSFTQRLAVLLHLHPQREVENLQNKTYATMLPQLFKQYTNTGNSGLFILFVTHRNPTPEDVWLIVTLVLSTVLQHS